MKKKTWFYFAAKRMFDFLASLLVILVSSPILLLLLIINTFATKGAPIYFDKRIGKNGKDIKVPKFRSMYKDANTNARKYLNEEQYRQWEQEKKVNNDPRITHFGKFLRKSSLDETLQLFCILIGTMSVVGPRPIPKSEMDLNYSQDEQEIFLSATPGLISNWGVNGRNLVTYNNRERQHLELEYFSKRSIWYDLKIIFKAVGVVVTRKGAQ